MKNQESRKITSGLFSAALPILLGTCLAAQAAVTGQWVSDSDGNWTDVNNWFSGTVPLTAGDTAILTNNITDLRTITLDSSVAVGALQIGSLDGATNFVIGGLGTLTLDNSGSPAVITSLSGNGQELITASLALAGNLTVDAAKDVTIEGVISETAPGAVITKEGAGTLLLTNINAYSGGLAINEGAIRVKTERSLGAAPAAATANNISINNNATLWLDTSNVLHRNRGIMISAGGATIYSTALSGIYGIIDGPGMLTKTGANTLFLATNFYKGGTWLKEGSLKLGSSSPTYSQLGSGDLTMEEGTSIFAWSTSTRTLTNRVIVKGDIRLGSTGTADRAILTLSGPVDFGDATRSIESLYTNSITGGISGAPGVGLVKVGSGELRLSNTNLYDGGTVIKEGRLSINNKGVSIDSLGFITPSISLSNVVFDGGELWIHDYATTLRNRGIWITQNGGAFTGKSIGTAAPIEGPGALTIRHTSQTIRTSLSGDNSFEGGLRLEVGKLRVGYFSSVLGTGPLTMESGTTLVGWTALMLTNPVIINGDFTLGSTTSGETSELTFTGPVSLGAATRTITCPGLSQTFTGVISGDSGAGITKLGANNGTLALIGPNTYSGPTTVSNGTLVVSTAHTGSGDFLASEYSTLGILREAASPTLLAPSLWVGDYAYLAFFLPSGPSSEPVIQVNNLTLNSTAFVKLYGGGYAVGTYPLIKYSTMTGSFDSAPQHLPSGVVATLVNNAATSTIELVVSGVTASSPLTWTGNVSGAWDFFAMNWIDSTSETSFSQGNSVLFDDSSTGIAAILKNTILQPASVTVSAAKNYGISGSGSMDGSMTLTKSGTGSLTLYTPNTYTGTTFVNEGALRAANTEGSATGTGEVVVQTAGILEGSGFVAGPVSIAAGGTLSPGSGLGTLTIAGSASMAAGSTNYFELNKSMSTNDVLVAGPITYGGTLVANNIAGDLAPGDSFILFSTTGGTPAGNFSEIILLNSTLKGQFAPATGILSIETGLADYPTNMTLNPTTGGFSIEWPETHKGWIVQSNSVDVADSASWFPIPGSDAGTSLTITVDPATPKVFYRLAKP